MDMPRQSHVAPTTPKFRRPNPVPPLLLVPVAGDCSTPHSRSCSPVKARGTVDFYQMSTPRNNKEETTAAVAALMQTAVTAAPYASVISHSDWIDAWASDLS